jgi:hypothetical protein
MNFLFFSIMAAAATPTLMPATDEPRATAKHTICGYAWGDVVNALIKSIGNADNARAQRWAAELVCSEQGLGRLEAALVHAWALHVGPAHPTWARTWYHHIQQIRQFWERTHGDTKAIRNTPVVRQMVAESVAGLVLAAKKPLPELPSAADCFREAEAMRQRIRAGAGVGDQSATRRVWTGGSDGLDLRTIGNEMEAALRSGQVSRLLFWIIWILTLEKQDDAPPVRERGPAHVSVKQRKSLVWYLVAILKEIANEGAYLSVEERAGLFGCFEICYVKLGEKGRRDMLAALALSIQEHVIRRGTPSISGPTAIPSMTDIRGALMTIDSVYSGIAAEARRYLLEVPKIVGLTAEDETVTVIKRTKINSSDKLALAYSLLGK